MAQAVIWGVQPNTTSCMFPSKPQKREVKAALSNTETLLPVSERLVAGSVAGCISQAVVYPLDAPCRRSIEFSREVGMRSLSLDLGFFDLGIQGCRGLGSSWAYRPSSKFGSDWKFWGPCTPISTSPPSLHPHHRFRNTLPIRPFI